MPEMLKAVASWPSLLLVVVVFGFTPGFCLRLIVLAYPRSDPRRTELIAELYAVPRIKRPLWVAEQLEVALFEGLARRHRALAVEVQRALRYCVLSCLLTAGAGVAIYVFLPLAWGIQVTGAWTWAINVIEAVVGAQGGFRLGWVVAGSRRQRRA